MDIRDEPDPPVLRRARRNCPLCGDLPIDTSRRPGSAEQWQGWWMSVTRRDIQPGPNQLGPAQRDGRSTALQLRSRPVRAAGPERHIRQSRLFMLFRRNVSVCAQCLGGLYFYSVPSLPATNDGSVRPLAEEPGTRRDDEDVTRDRNGELCATGIGLMSGVADADAGLVDDEIQQNNGPIPVAVSGPAPAADGNSGQASAIPAAPDGPATPAASDGVAAPDAPDASDGVGETDAPAVADASAAAEALVAAEAPVTTEAPVTADTPTAYDAAAVLDRETAKSTADAAQDSASQVGGAQADGAQENAAPAPGKSGAAPGKGRVLAGE
jgi:hypothetical protein